MSSFEMSTRGHAWDAVADLTAGTAGGIACVYAGQPLDTVKVKMQTFSHLYSSSFRCFTQTWSSEKWMGRMRDKKVDDLSPVENALAGSSAAVFSSLVLCPTELVKCRLQAMREMRSTGSGSLGSAETAHGPLSLTKHILRTEGIRGLFKGLVPTFAREVVPTYEILELKLVPGYFFFFGGYELTREALRPPDKTKDQIGVWRTGLSGGVGGTSLWVAIFPADVVKSRVQVDGGGTFLGTTKNILAEKGIRGLYQGLGPTIIRSFFATGVLFVAYEYTKKALHRLPF